MKAIVTLLALGLLLSMGSAGAHPLAPALLELTELAPERYAVLWRTPVVRSGAGVVEPRLPAACTAKSPPDVQPASAEVLTARWVAECPGGLEGGALAVDGLPGSGINVIVRVVSRDGGVFQGLLGADQPEVVLRAAQPPFLRYLALGAEHLVIGFDHLLFLLGLFLLVGTSGARDAARKLVLTVTAFTAGHSVTLGAATAGVVPLSQAVAEVLIAATVLMLALELSRDRSVPAISLLRRRPALMAGGFGMIHGLGFAGALRDVGVPVHELPLALLGFNLGIELAQLAVVGALWLAALALRGVPVPRLAQLAPSYVIGSMAACWLLERSVGLLA